MAKSKIADPLSAYHAAVHIHGMAGASRRSPSFSPISTLAAGRTLGAP